MKLLKFSKEVFICHHIVICIAVNGSRPICRIIFKGSIFYRNFYALEGTTSISKQIGKTLHKCFYVIPNTYVVV